MMHKYNMFVFVNYYYIIWMLCNTHSSVLCKLNCTITHSLFIVFWAQMSLFWNIKEDCLEYVKCSHKTWQLVFTNRTLLTSCTCSLQHTHIVNYWQYLNSCYLTLEWLGVMSNDIYVTVHVISTINERVQAL